MAKSSKIYLDYAATTPVDKEVLKAMMPYFKEKFGNPSSVHSFGQEAMAAVDEARESVAGFFSCDFDEIIFTGSATESNNLAVKGLAGRNKIHIISTTIEHESVHEPLRELVKNGHEVTHVKCDREGIVKVRDIEKAIKDNTALVSVIYANNEIGTIQPVKETGRSLQKINAERKERGLGRIYFHTDAVQAVNYLECRPDWLKADLLTFSGHKIYGPKGIGGLYVRKNILLKPIISGGGQEFGRRSGTENTASIVGFAKALELVKKHQKRETEKITKLRDRLLNAIISVNKGVRLNGPPVGRAGSLKFRLPNNINLRFPGRDNESFLIMLDRMGLAVSAGSACAGKALSVSHVLTAVGLSAKQAKESVRITLGRGTTGGDVEKAAAIMKTAYEKLLS